MGIVFGILASFVQLLVLVGIVVFIVRAVTGRKTEQPTDSAPVTVKRVFLFGSLYATLHVAAWGVAGLIALLAEGVDGRGERAAVPLAMTIVAVPILFFLGRWALRTVADRRERGPAFSIYLNAALVTAVIVVLVTSIMAGRWLVGEGDFNEMALASLLVWSPIWAGHWLLWRTYCRDVTNLHVYVGATVGLVTMAGFGGALLAEIFSRLLDSATALEVGRGVDSDVSTWVVGFAVGAAIFAWHWIYAGMREERDALWHAYVVLVGVLGGLITLVAGAGVTLFAILQWWFGDPGTNSAVRHFEDFIPAFAAVIVGAAVWYYHRRVLGPVTGERTEVQRVYDYVVAAVGLVTAVVGLVILVVGFQEVVFPPAESMTSEVDILLGALTTLAVGVPLWTQAWLRANRFLEAPESSEASSPTRRSYLFGIIGIGGIVAAVSLIVLLVTIFNSVLGAGGELRDSVQVPVALIVTVGAVAVYHFLVQREEQEQAPVVLPPKQVVLVTGSDTLAGAVRDLTGARVTVLHRLDANGEAADAAAVAAAVAASEFDQLLVVPGLGGAVQVIPYRR